MLAQAQIEVYFLMSLTVTSPSLQNTGILFRRVSSSVLLPLSLQKKMTSRCCLRVVQVFSLVKIFRIFAKTLRMRTSNIVSACMAADIKSLVGCLAAGRRGSLVVI
jgi:hypothetical protein